MSKAFIFDLDGVLIDDEQIWEDEKAKLYVRLFGSDVASRLGSTSGIHLDEIIARATRLGSDVDKDHALQAFFDVADTIYHTAPITANITELTDVLKAHNYKLAIVSASPPAWVSTVIERLPFKNDLALVISLYERDDLQHKPEPDGYLAAMHELNADPAETIILEDSNAGIASAKASGAYTIGFRQNLIKSYEQQGADTYADTVQDVIKIVQNRTA